MRLKIKLFAVLKDRIGESNITLDLPQDLNAGELKTIIKNQYPAVGDVINLARVAVNEEFVADREPINEEDFVALIPPSSGG
ncbi:MoaD/ThiS family protein [Bacteroidota bacterium]